MSVGFRADGDRLTDAITGQNRNALASYQSWEQGDFILLGIGEAMPRTGLPGQAARLPTHILVRRRKLLGDYAA